MNQAAITPPFHHHSSHKKQPKGLYILFFAEIWERYAFYTMQALLVLF